METTKTTLIIANMPTALLAEMNAAAAAAGLPLMLWLKLIIRQELDRTKTGKVAR